MNSHDLEAVLSYIHPTFVGKTKQGFSVGYQDIARMVAPLFAPGRDYQETVEIEEIEARGDSAKLVTRRSERGRMYHSKQVGLFNGLGMMCLLMFGIWFFKLLRAGEWNFHEGPAAVVAGVLSVALIGGAFFMRRPRQRTVRYQETWRKIDGRWLVVEEQEL